ncbi:phage tail protein [Pseudomonas sp. TWI923]|uniref:phage tail-collar fiber domain-containing protein n=1 Tax=Pseudomonas sp. TWI923 TaxID=3136794 RepID=UPI00320AAB7D
MANSTTQFGGFLTNVGVAQQANSAALGLPWNITHMLIGDAGGDPAQVPDPTPSPAQTALVRRMYRAPLNALYKSPVDPNVLVAELVLPPEIGGWWIRELGLEDADGNFIAVAKPPPSYKPLLQQGSGRTQTIRMHVVFGNVANISLKIDPSIVLATRDYVDKAREANELYARNQVKAHAEAADPHPQYLRRADVAKDAGPLAWVGLATGTANALVLALKSSEAVLPAYAAGQRFQFQAAADNTGAVTAKVGGLAAKEVKKAGATGLVDLAAGDIRAGVLFELSYNGTVFQLREAFTDVYPKGQTYSRAEVDDLLKNAGALPVGAVVAFPMTQVPTGFLELNGTPKSIAMYPALATYLGTKYNKGDEEPGYFRLPDYRGEFLRGLDNGRGLDPDRVIGSSQLGTAVAFDDATGFGVAGWHAMTTADDGKPELFGADRASRADYPNGNTQLVTSATSTLVTVGMARPHNIAAIWCIKAWGSAVNQGQLDVAALAALVAAVEQRQKALGDGQTNQNLTATRLMGTTYTNTTGRTIWFQAAVSMLQGVSSTVTVGGEQRSYIANNGTGGVTGTHSVPVLHGESYSVNGGTLVRWNEVRT